MRAIVLCAVLVAALGCGEMAPSSDVLASAAGNAANALPPRAELSMPALLQKSPAELRVLRNEVFARHGRAFSSADLRAHFEAQSWYRADPAYSDDRLSDADRARVALISSMETQRDPVSVGEFAGSPALFFEDSSRVREIDMGGLYEQPSMYAEASLYGAGDDSLRWTRRGDWVVVWRGGEQLQGVHPQVFCARLDYENNVIAERIELDPDAFAAR